MSLTVFNLLSYILYLLWTFRYIYDNPFYSHVIIQEIKRRDFSKTKLILQHGCRKQIKMSAMLINLSLAEIRGELEGPKIFLKYLPSLHAYRRGFEKSEIWGISFTHDHFMVSFPSSTCPILTFIGIQFRIITFENYSKRVFFIHRKSIGLADKHLFNNFSSWPNIRESGAYFLRLARLHYVKIIWQINCMGVWIKIQSYWKGYNTISNSVLKRNVRFTWSQKH